MNTSRNIKVILIAGLCIFVCAVTLFNSNTATFKTETTVPDNELSKPYVPTIHSILSKTKLLKPEQTKILRKDISHEHISPIVAAARAQIGVVTEYDGGYYEGGYPPENRGVCSDVISRALRENGYDLKEKIDTDMLKNPKKYSRAYDPNINFRRVVNIENYFNDHAKSMSPIVPTDNNWSDWLPGDIITYKQIPGQLWHIAIISEYATPDGVPLIIHNYGVGTQENDMLLTWPSDINKRYRIEI